MPTLAQRALMLKVNLAAHGIAITVTRPGEPVVAATGIWHVAKRDDQPYGTDFQNIGARRVMTIARSGTVPNAPRGTVITAADIDGGVTKSWRVDGYDAPAEADYMRLILVETT